MELKLTQKQFRRLLDLVYIGNWVLNSTRGDDRIRDYDRRIIPHRRSDNHIFSYQASLSAPQNISADLSCILTA